MKTKLPTQQEKELARRVAALLEKDRRDRLEERETALEHFGSFPLFAHA